MPDDNDNLNKGSCSPLEGTFGSDVMMCAQVALTSLSVQRMAAVMTLGMEGPAMGMAALDAMKPVLGLGLAAAGLNALLGGPTQRPTAPAPPAPKGLS